MWSFGRPSELLLFSCVLLSATIGHAYESLGLSGKVNDSSAGFSMAMWNTGLFPNQNLNAYDVNVQRPYILEQIKAASENNMADVICITEAWLGNDLRAIANAISDSHPYFISKGNLSDPTNSRTACADVDLSDAAELYSCAAIKCNPLVQIVEDASGWIDDLRDWFDDIWPFGTRDVSILQENESEDWAARCVRDKCGGESKPVDAFGSCSQCLIQSLAILGDQTWDYCTKDPTSGQDYETTWGLLLASRLPFENVSMAALESFSENRGVLYGEVESPSAGRVGVLCTHLTPVFDQAELDITGWAEDYLRDENMAQTRKMIQFLDERAAETNISQQIAAGDFNFGPDWFGLTPTIPESQDIMMQSGFADPWLVRGCLSNGTVLDEDIQAFANFTPEDICTFCNWHPLINGPDDEVGYTIDHIFTRGFRIDGSGECSNAGEKDVNSSVVMNAYMERIFDEPITVNGTGEESIPADHFGLLLLLVPTSNDSASDPSESVEPEDDDFDFDIDDIPRLIDEGLQLIGIQSEQPEHERSAAQAITSTSAMRVQATGSSERGARAQRIGVKRLHKKMRL